jgi:biotin--protein ligase
MAKTRSQKQILVYSGDGVGGRAAEIVPRTLLDALGGGGWGIRTISAAQIIGGGLDGATGFVVPGGADTPYCRDLFGAGCSAIRRFVTSGGVYIGFCAGAYFAARSIEWNRGQPDEIIAPRELGFFSGVAVGPVSGPGTYDPVSDRGARIFRLLTEDGDEAWSFFNGGCAFVGDSPSTTVIARYADYPGTPAAAVRVSIGKGFAILSGIHPEYDSAALPNEHPLKARLSEVDADRRRILHHILKPLQEKETV